MIDIGDKIGIKDLVIDVASEPRMPLEIPRVSQYPGATEATLRRWLELAKQDCIDG